jgi:hypothetical protein
LEEPVEVLPVAPTAAKIVVAELARGQVGDNGINPVGQLYGQTGDFAAEEPVGALDRFRQRKALASGSHGGGVLYLSLEMDDVGHVSFPLFLSVPKRGLSADGSRGPQADEDSWDDEKPMPM